MLTTNTDQYDVRWVTDAQTLAAMKPDWDRLLSRHPAPEAFYGIEWSLANLDVPGTCLLTMTVSASGQMIGIIPLCRRGEIVDFIASGLADYNDILCEPQYADALFDITLQHVRRRMRTCTLQFSNTRTDSLIFTAARKRIEQLPIRLTKIYNCASVDFSSDRVAVLQNLASKKSLRRHARYFETTGTVKFEIIREYEKVAQHLERYFWQQSIRRAVCAQSSAFMTARGRHAARSLIQAQAADKSLRCAVLWYNGAPIAYHYGFLKYNKYYWYKPSFDIAWWDRSPGEVLIKHLLMSLIDENCNEFDFTIGDEAFKDRFANRYVGCYLIRVFPRWLSPLMGAWKWAHKHREAIQRVGHRFQRLPQIPRAAIRTAIRARQVLSAICTQVVTKGIMQCAREAFVRSYVVNVYVLRTAARGDLRPLEGMQLRRNDINGFMQAVLDGRTKYAISDMPMLFRRARNGDSVYYLMHGADLVHVSWVGARRAIDVSYELGVACIVPLSSIHMLIYDCWTHPAYRGRGIYSAVIKHIAAEYHDRHPACIYCRVDNIASVRGIEKSGFIHAMTIKRRVSWGYRSRLEISGNI